MNLQILSKANELRQQVEKARDDYSHAYNAMGEITIIVRGYEGYPIKVPWKICSENILEYLKQECLKLENEFENL